MATVELNIIKRQSKELSDRQKRELVEFLNDQLENSHQGSTTIKFGKYSSSNRPMSTEESFRVAEWQPTDFDLNGK